MVIIEPECEEWDHSNERYPKLKLNNCKEISEKVRLAEFTSELGD